MWRKSLPLLFLLAVACSSASSEEASRSLAEQAHRLTGAATDYDPLFRAIGDAHLVLLGEATHGTHEFYVERARITRRLIEEKKFTALALEADWSDAARVDRYVRGVSEDRTAAEALRGFEKFPVWMWRNQEFAELVEAIRAYNDALPAGAMKAGVYGLDLYGVPESLDQVVQHLGNVDPAMAAEARRRYACFEPFRNDEDRLAMTPCADEAKAQYEAVHARFEQATDPRQLDELFFAEQNARVVMNGEEYYRESLRGRVSTWNLRDRHMVVTMDALQRYLLRRNGRDHIIVWAHNSHVGDARATSVSRHGEWNMGQLVRERWPRGSSFSLGFTTHTGTVMAAHEWGGSPALQQLNPSLPGSHGRILHDTGIPAFLLILGEVEGSGLTRNPRQQRAVGVIYLPRTEVDSHYFTATLHEQFDAVIHIDQTTAVSPLP
ncbi:MAG TPA: erythromycin esterase family protein [Thermoanaerobaculia bacterium]|jgi:erythromycin esterase-like protein